MGVRQLRVAAFLASVLCLVLGPGVAARVGAQTDARQTEAQPTADEIFAKARRVWDTQPYPVRLDYIVTVRVIENGKSETSHYTGEYAPGSKDLHVTAMAAEQLVNPDAPHGFTVKITRRFNGKNVMAIPINKEASEDYLGVPLLDPTYSFGLAGRIETVGPEPLPTNDANAPGVIGTVIARAKLYSVTLLGIEPYGEGRAYHLALTPLRDPRRYRLRELWVDAARFVTLKALTEGNFAEGPGTRVNWTITFQTIDGAQYIDTETAAAPLHYGPRHFEEATISFGSIQARHGLPPTKFLFEQLPLQNVLTEPKG